MLTELAQLRELLDKSQKPKKLILAASEDAHSLNAIVSASEQEIIQPILVGDKEQTFGMAEILNLDISKFEFIDAGSPVEAVTNSVKMMHDGKADVLMKGKVGTSDMLRSILNKDYGLRSGKLLSHFAYFEVETYHKLIAVTDVAMNIAPTLTEKISILNNSVKVLNNLGIDMPKVAVLGAVEKVNTAMDATLDAALLSKMNQRDQILNCIVDGPLAFDNAISFERRGGKQSKNYEFAGSNNLDEVGWYKSNSQERTHPVGEKKPNELGLYDMSGNVYEWHDGIDPNGLSRSDSGGSWLFGNCVVNNHGGHQPVQTANWLGFRLARNN